MIIEVVLKNKAERNKVKRSLENTFKVDVNSLIGMEVGPKEIPLYILRFETNYNVEPIQVYSLIDSTTAKVFLTPSA